MHRFRGDPTYFGFPSCDDEGECSPVAVVKYSPEEDKWEELQGELETPRRGHLVLQQRWRVANFCIFCGKH